MKEFIKPSGVVVSVCESSYQAALDAGWEVQEPKKVEVKADPKRETLTVSKNYRGK